MMNKVPDSYTVYVNGLAVNLPILCLPDGVGIAFFNLHGNQMLTEHCGKSLAPLVSDCDVIFTVESKGLQLAHVIARELGHSLYAVARKTKKLYMQDGIEIEIQSSITTGTAQKLYLSRSDAELLNGKKVAVIDDVISTGNSLNGAVELIRLAGGIVHKKAFVLAEGEACKRNDIIFLDKIPLFF